jgi:membrane protein YdbS with pleckstrin-like domain
MSPTEPETQEPVAQEPAAAAEPEEQPTASERLLEAARSGGEKSADSDPGTEWTEGGYSPKALNGRFLLTCVASILLLVLSAWLNWGKEWGPWIWYPSLALVAALWIWFACVRIYRVWTIKYQLTAHQFYHEEGIFRRIRDVIEVIDIDDLKLERTLWDRIINGGVGTVSIKSTDVTDPILRLIGLDDPEVVFKSLDEARRKERAARGLKSV